jgi:hypothetical protein
MKLFIPLILLFCLILCGCNTTAPKCDSKEAQDTVLEIVEEQIAPQLYEDKELNSLIYSLDVIRTTDFNKNIGKYSCAADLIVKNRKDGKKVDDIDITYTVENASGGQYYVTVSWD